MKIRRSAALCSMACMAAVAGLAMPTAAADLASLQGDFQGLAIDARPMVRWWWFGPAMTTAGIDHELQAMKDGGIGGFEAEPSYPLAVDQTTNGVTTTNLKLISPQHLSLLNYTAAKAKTLGLRMDMTLGSGWPFGGPHIPPELAAGWLRVESVPVGEAADRVPLPRLKPGEKLPGGKPKPPSSSPGPRVASSPNS